MSNVSFIIGLSLLSPHLLSEAHSPSTYPLPTALCCHNENCWQILDGQGSIDLLLERAGQVLACEITVTTTVDHEVGNVAKCLKAGFPQVVMVSSDESRLRRIAVAVESSLGVEMAKQVLFYLPDQLITHLQSLPKVSTPAPDQPKVRRGYKVTTKHVQLSPQEMKAREDAAITAIAEAMKKKARNR